jgi:hypothetical protein
MLETLAPTFIPAVSGGCGCRQRDRGEERGILHQSLIDSLWTVAVRVFALMVSLHDPQSPWHPHCAFQVSWICSRVVPVQPDPSALETASAATECSKMAHMEMPRHRP